MPGYPSSLSSFGSSEFGDFVVKLLNFDFSDDFQINSDLALAGFNSPGILHNWSTQQIASGVAHGKYVSVSKP